MRGLRATTVYYGLSFGGYMPTWVVMAVYLVNELHLSPLQLVLMGTAMEAAVFLFEVPTGVVADTYSRRLSLVIGYLGMGLAWLAVGARLGAVADHRALGRLGARVHLHERRRGGLDHGRGRRRQGRAALPARRALAAGRRGRGPRAPGRRRHAVAAGGRDPGRRLHDRSAGSGASSSCPRPGSGGGRARSALRRSWSCARLRWRSALRLGRAGDRAAGRGRGFHGRLQRGVRPA